MVLTLNCKGKLLTLDQPRVMGIININEDSFYAASRIMDVHALIVRAEKMISDGASILDIGAMSSRPGANIITPEEELKRLMPAVNSLVASFPDTIISVDTVHSKVASEVICSGVSMINDISAGEYDPAMIAIVAKESVPYVMMHMKGLPSDMQLNPVYHDIVLEIMQFFTKKIHHAKASGIKDIIIDPGFGFGKTLEHNFELMRNLEVFRIFDVPVLIGVSRKSMIWKSLNTDAAHALNGTTALHMHALQQGAKILRVHDVKEAMECIEIHRRLTE
jgi:dihydropteroate synthase